MPTGYTSQIKSDTTFQQFAMLCARAMGALVMMREEPLNAPIPERFEPTDYHANKLKKAQEDLAWLQQMADVEADREAARQFEAESMSHVNHMQEMNEGRARYTAMLNRVAAWEPPTDEHRPFKSFMVDQLTSTIRMDCDATHFQPPVKLTGQQWLTLRIAEATRDISYHTKAHAEEVERTESRNTWLRALRESLKVTAS